MSRSGDIALLVQEEEEWLRRKLSEQEERDLIYWYLHPESPKNNPQPQKPQENEPQ